MNILLTSVGRRSYLVKFFKDAQKGKGKVFVANSEPTIAMENADGSLITPLIYSDQYIPCLLDFCKTYEVSAIISLFDVDLLVLASNRHLFNSIGVRVILAEENFVRICNDKWKTYEFFEKLDIKTPKTFLSEEDVLSAIENNEVVYPIVVKPRWGSGSMGINFAENKEELQFYTSITKKVIANTYLKYESAITAENQVIYQEKIDGEEYGLDILNDLDGNYIKTFAKQKITMRAGETDTGRTVNSALFEHIAKKVAETSKHEGLLSLDCIKDKNNDIYALEMNCRISGHYPLSYLAGFNYPQLLVNWIEGRRLNKSLLSFRENLLIVKDIVPKIASLDK